MLFLIISLFFRSCANTFLLHLQVCVGMGGYVWYVWRKANISLNEKSEPIEIDVIGLSWVIIAIGKRVCVLIWTALVLDDSKELIIEGLRDIGHPETQYKSLQRLFIPSCYHNVKPIWVLCSHLSRVSLLKTDLTGFFALNQLPPGFSLNLQSGSFNFSSFIASDQAFLCSFNNHFCWNQIRVLSLFSFWLGKV